jgi:hypothetical protein
MLITGTPTRSSRNVVSDVPVAWRWAGRFSLVLLLAGLGDWAIAMVPFRLGTLEWEFGTITAIFAGLPLVTLGFAGVLAAAIARGAHWQIVATAVTIILFSLIYVAALVVFLLDVPIALRTVQGVALLGIKKAITKNVFFGVLFSVAYLWAGIAALRHAARRRAQ